MSELALRKAILAVATELSARRGQHEHWRRLQERTLWYELGACLLGSQVRFEQAAIAAQQLKAAGLLWERPDLRQIGRFERAVAEILLRPLKMKNGQRARYRFPRSRAALLRRAAVAIYSNGGTIRELLNAASCGQEARCRLVTVIPGIGPKQASLFLRNVSYADDLAVLDVHVLRYMRWIEAAPNIGLRLQSLSEYERIEERFRRHAVEMGVPVGHLDLAVWVTVRALVEEKAP